MYVCVCVCVVYIVNATIDWQWTTFARSPTSLLLAPLHSHKECFEFLCVCVIWFGYVCVSFFFVCVDFYQVTITIPHDYFNCVWLYVLAYFFAIILDFLFLHWVPYFAVRIRAAVCVFFCCILLEDLIYFYFLPTEGMYVFIDLCMCVFMTVCLRKCPTVTFAVRWKYRN